MEPQGKQPQQQEEWVNLSLTPKAIPWLNLVAAAIAWLTAFSNSGDAGLQYTSAIVGAVFWLGFSLTWKT